MTRKQFPQELAIATYNVENLAPTDQATKFTKLAQGIVNNLASPDIVAVEEVQDNDGATDDGVVAANITLTDLTNAIVAAGGPQYDWREIDPVNDQDGGAPGGNIRQVFLFNPERVSFVDIPGGDVDRPRCSAGQAWPAAAVRVARPHRARRPGLERQPQAARRRVPVPRPGCVRGGEPLRRQARRPAQRGRVPAAGPALRAQREPRRSESVTSSATCQKIDPTANIVVVGDLNDYQFSPAATCSPVAEP